MRAAVGWRVPIVLLGWVVACSAPSQETTQAVQTANPVPETIPRTASADLEPAPGSQVKGAITFLQSGGPVQVVAHVRGLQPGPHRLSIQESGDCSAADASVAGGSFDLGKLVADQDGYAQLEAGFESLSLSEGVNSIIGRGVVVRREANDEPAGATVACGVVAAHPVPTGPREGSGL